MDRRIHRDQATTNVLAWTATQACNVEPSVEEEAGADTDEPPDRHLPQSPIQKHFTRAPVRRGSEQHESLLTKALQSNSDDESGSAPKPLRRRSVTSNVSLASTADWTCETGITTPARTSSPSPRLAAIGFVPIARNATKANRPKDPAVQALEKKRCISFACAARPTPEPKPALSSPPKPVVEVSKAPETQKRTSIKFACTQPPPRVSITTPAINVEARTPVPRVSISTLADEATPRPTKARSPSHTRLRSATPRSSSRSPVATRSKKYLTAHPGDLQSECARFHEFASDEPQEDDWIRRDDTSSKPKLTINDTLSKENAIRKLGKEAEEEAELEEEEEEDEEDDDEEDEDEDEDDEDNDEDLEDVDDEDDEDECEDNGDDASDIMSSKYDFRDGASDGYNTDNEVGFAESDDEDDDLVLWTTKFAMPLSISGTTPVCRRKSVDGQSESSGCSRRNSRVRRGKNREKAPALRPDTPELPDSTDFVCGTLDEDRPLEEAYISQLVARRQNKLLPIPQDIDPSFPTSEPEDEAEELYKKGYGDSDDHLWLHGELEDLHHERDRKGRKKKPDNPSPKRCRSPPPKRRHSPAPQARGRSDRRLFDRTSPRRFRSPAPRPALSASPAISPLHVGEGIAFKSLAFRPGLTHTKSLPRAPDLFNHLNKSKKVKAEMGNDGNENHVRGAIDIVKGLEQKRQRRKEKFYQKYCNQARKAKAQVRRPVPGQGAQRMREVGLIMAGKIGQGNYVLSV
ncbi:Protein of unknown function (DUF2457) domain containing protein [Naviculisporaceae sp. PSN 640]